MAREMKDSGIEWIGAKPATWQVALASQVFSQVKCKNTGLVEQNLLSLSYGKIKRKSIDATAGLLPESFDGYNIIERDDIVLRLTDLQNDHKSLRVGRTTERGIITSAYLSIRPSKNHDSQFLYYYLHSFDICKGLYGMGSGVRQGLNWDDIKRLQILVPPQSEQKQIASFLDRKCAEIDSVIADIQHTIEEYKALKQSIISSAVTRGVRGKRGMQPTGIEWIGDIPVDWSLCRIGSQYFERRTKVSDVDYPPLSVTKKGVVPQLETAAKTDAHDDRKLVRVGDFAINSRSDRRGSCGISGYEGSVSLINTILVPRDAMDPQYYEWLFHSVGFADEFYKWGHGIVDDLWTTGWQDMKKIVIPRPPMDEQREIAEYLESKCTYIDTLIDQKTQLLSELDAYRKSVIYEYVTGKKEVPACQ